MVPMDAPLASLSIMMRVLVFDKSVKKSYGQ
jgi:hypothetical protein